MQQTSEFHIDCYALCHSGRAMPARFIEVSPDGLVTVESPQGRQYTFHESHILPVEEAEAHLRSHRAEYVALNYQFEPLASDRWQTAIRVTHPEHPSRSYVLTIRKNRRGGLDGSPSLLMTCSCPAFIKSGADCKHLAAYRMIQGEEPAQVGKAPATPPAEKAPATTPNEEDYSDIIDGWKPGGEW